MKNTTTNTTTNNTAVVNNTVVANNTKTNNVNKEMVSMMNGKLTNKVVTNALKSVAAEQGIKFPKELAVTMRLTSNGYVLDTNAYEVLITKANLSPITNKGGNKLSHSFPYQVAFASAKRINSLLTTKEFEEKVIEVLTKDEIRNSVLVKPELTERKEKIAALQAIQRRKQLEKQKGAMYANFNRDRKVNKSINKACFKLYNKTTDLVENALVELNKANHIPAEKLNVSKFIEEGRKNILKKELSVTVNVLTAYMDSNDNLRVNATVSTMNENEAIRKGLIKSCVLPGAVYNAKYGRTSIPVENFTKDIIMLDLSQVPSASFSMMELHVWWKGADTIFATEVDGQYIDLITNKVVKRKADARRIYKVIGGSPSQLRKSQTSAFDVTDGFENMDNILEILTEGAYSKEYGKKVTKPQLAKYVTRFFSWTAPNKVVGVVNHPAVYFGKWCNDALDGAGYVSANFYAKCMEDITGIKVNPKDVLGIGVQCRPYSAKVFAPVIEKELFEVLYAEAKGVKYISEVTEEITKQLNQAFCGNGPLAGYVVVFGEEGTVPEFMSDLNGYKTVFNWGAPSNFRVLDIAKSGIAHTSIQMWEVPLNNDPQGSVALMKELREEQFGDVFESLFIDRKAKVPSYIETSKSLYAYNLIKSIAPDYVLDKDLALLKKVVEEFAERDNKASNKFKWEIAGEYSRLTSDIALICSKLGLLQYGEAFSPAAIKYFANGENAPFGKEARVRETWAKRICTMFKYPKMGVKECYKFTAVTLETIKARLELLDINKTAKKAIYRFFATMKPGMMVVPGVEWLKKQCAGLDFDYDGATIVFDSRFNALISDDNCITNIILKEKTAQKQEKATTGLAAKISASNINKSSNSTETYALKAETLHNSYLNYINSNSDGWSVGSITNCNSTQIAVLQLVKAAKGETREYYLNLMRTMLGRWFGKGDKLAEGGEGEYIGLSKHNVSLCDTMDAYFDEEQSAKLDEIEKELGLEKDVTVSTYGEVTDVSPSAIDRVVQEIISADWNSEQNLIHIFEDLNDIFRFYQEIIIDSAKTGETVKVAIAPGRAYHALEINNNTIKFDWDYKEGLKGSKFAVVVNEKAPSMKKTPFKDLLFRTRKMDLAKDLEASIQAIFNSKDCGLNMNDLTVLAKVFNTNKYLELNKAFNGLKKIYGDLVADRTNKIQFAGDDEEAQRLINKQFKLDVERLAATGRKLVAQSTVSENGKIATVKMNEVRLGAYVKFISAFSFDKNGMGTPAANGGNNFGATVFQREFLAYVIKNYAMAEGCSKIDYCGEKLTYNACYQDGDVVEFKDGVNEFALTHPALNGTFTIKEYDGKFYATRSILDTIPQTEEDDTVMFRINNEKERSFEEIAETLKVNADVELHAYYDVTDPRNKVFDYAMYDAEGNKLCDMDATKSVAMHFILNGKKGKITNIIQNRTVDVNGNEKSFLIVTVK